jgi:metal-sulfur cluster biosynthetic enzyme
MADDVDLEEKILENLSKVVDPELGFDVVTLQLIREIHINSDNDVIVIMTLTSPACPFGDFIKMEVEFAVRAVKGVNRVKVDITFDPPWTLENISEEAKLALGLL